MNVYGLDEWSVKASEMKDMCALSVHVVFKGSNVGTCRSGSIWICLRPYLDVTIE